MSKKKKFFVLAAVAGAAAAAALYIKDKVMLISLDDFMDAMNAEDDGIKKTDGEVTNKDVEESFARMKEREAAKTIADKAVSGGCNCDKKAEPEKEPEEVVSEKAAEKSKKKAKKSEKKAAGKSAEKAEKDEPCIGCGGQEDDSFCRHCPLFPRFKD